jgi:endonuclease-3
MFSEETRRRRVRKIIPILREEYPNAGPRLHFSNPLELLIASILAAQCTDDKVNEVTRDLFKKYRTAEDYLKADLNVFMGEIHSTGTFRRKTLRIKSCCEALILEHGGQVPDDMEVLTSLPGIGRKTANMILVNAFGQPGIIMDTHVARVSPRIGLTDKKLPDTMEKDLVRVVAKKDWADFSHLIMFHGREICVSRKPRCEKCRIDRLCDYFRSR